MFERFRGAGTVLAGSLALLLAACGGGGGGGGGNGGGSDPAKSCADQFTADKAAADAGSCQPNYHAQCDSLDLRLPINAMNPSDCTKGGADGGVTYQNLTVGDTNYVLVTPPADASKGLTGGKKGLYIALHWRSGNGATMINNMRLAELAKARDITIAAPTSPHPVLGLGPVGLIRDWDYSGAADAISAVINHAKAQAQLSSVPVVIAGVSSGAAGATRFFCERGNEARGLLLVASGTISSESTSGCLSAAAASKAGVEAKAAVSSIPVVLVEGIDDPAYDTTVARYGQFKSINGCSAAAAANQTVALNDQVDIAFNTSCDDGAALVTVKDSGHNWPGMDRPIPSNPVTDSLSLLGTSTAMSIFGKVSFSFDATIQGYDLVRSLD
ncbi:MAG TPA: hypothetical protein VGE22_16710 [Solimonas sp.]